MANNGSEDKDEKRIIKFALLIQLIVQGNKINYEIRSENEGIADSEIILIVESWLDKVKENYKNKIKDSLMFGDKK